MQINEEELKYVISQLIPEDDEDWWYEQFIKVLTDYRSSILTTYNK